MFQNSANTVCFATYMGQGALRSNKHNSVLLSCFDSYRRQFLVESQDLAQSHQDLDKKLLWIWTKKSHR